MFTQASKSLIVNQFHFYIVYMLCSLLHLCGQWSCLFVPAHRATLRFETHTHSTHYHPLVRCIIPTSTCSRTFNHSFIHTHTHYHKLICWIVILCDWLRTRHKYKVAICIRCDVEQLAFILLTCWVEFFFLLLLLVLLLMCAYLLLLLLLLLLFCTLIPMRHMRFEDL